MSQQFLDRPVFISGYNKSGTTLMLSLLDSHPQLAVIPEELHYFRNVLFATSRLEALKTRTGFKLFLSDDYLTKWRKGKSWFKKGYPDFGKGEFEMRLRDVDRNLPPKELLLATVEAFFLTAGTSTERRWWVAKTTQEEIFFPIMRKMFRDNMHFFYLVRDPRDVHVSFSKRAAIVTGDSSLSRRALFRFLISWKVQVNMAQSYHSRFGNFHLIKYEDLVRNTEEVTRRVAQVLNIKHSVELLTPTRQGRFWEGNSVFSDGFTRLSTEPIGRYRSRLDGRIRKLIEWYLEKELTAFGYVVAGNPSAENNAATYVGSLSCRLLEAMYRIRYLIRQGHYSRRYALRYCTSR